MHGCACVHARVQVREMKAELAQHEVKVPEALLAALSAEQGDMLRRFMRTCHRRIDSLSSQVIRLAERERETARSLSHREDEVQGLRALLQQSMASSGSAAGGTAGSAGDAATISGLRRELDFAYEMLRAREKWLSAAQLLMEGLQEQLHLLIRRDPDGPSLLPLRHDAVAAAAMVAEGEAAIAKAEASASSQAAAQQAHAQAQGGAPAAAAAEGSSAASAAAAAAGDAAAEAEAEAVEELKVACGRLATVRGQHACTHHVHAVRPMGISIEHTMVGGRKPVMRACMLRRHEARHAWSLLAICSLAPLIGRSSDRPACVCLP